MVSLTQRSVQGAVRHCRTKSIMRHKLLAASLPVLLFAISIPAASAFEIQAGHIRSEDGQRYLYRENVEIRFAPEEAFEISADEITEEDGATRYSGNVRIAFKSMRLEADQINLIRETDGGQLITSENADLTVLDQ